MSDLARGFGDALARVLPNKVRPEGSALAVACSGGADSAALAWLLVERAKREGLPLPALLHINHHWSEDSALLQTSAERLATHLGVVLRVGDLDPSAGTDRLGREGAARRARYRALASLALPEEIIALAHHADDVVETQLGKLAQGAGLSGLAGPREAFDAHGVLFVRPLLSASRDELRSIVAASKLPAEEDPSNADHSLLRNAVRDLVVPPLTSLHGSEALRRSGAVLAGDSRAFSGALDALLNQLCQQASQQAPAIALPVEALSAMPAETRSALLRRGWHRVGLKRPNRALVQRTAQLVGALPGSDATGPACRAERWWHHVVLSPSTNPRAPLASIENSVCFAAGSAAAGGYRVTSATANARPDVATRELFAFDADEIQGDLVLRLAAPGERMVGFGRGRSERVATLHSTKATPEWRERHSWVIADRNGPLLVCGGKRSDRAPISSATTSVVVFHVDCA